MPILVKPAVRPDHDGKPVPMKIRHPQTRDFLSSDEATELDPNDFTVARLIRDGDLEVVQAPFPDAPASEAPAPLKTGKSGTASVTVSDTPDLKA